MARNIEIKARVPSGVDLCERVADMADDARLVELGCGYGRVMHTLTEAGFTNITGYDSSQAVIARGRSSFPGLDLQRHDVRNTPEPDGSTDAVVVCSILTCTPDDADRVSVVAEITRILKPGGSLHMVEFARAVQRSEDDPEIYVSSLGVRMRHLDESDLLAAFVKIRIASAVTRTISGRPARTWRLRTTKPIQAA